MEDDISNNNERLRNTTSDLEFEKLSTMSVVIMRTNSSLIIGLNGLVIACLIAGKTKFSSAYWIQLMTMSINDIIAGISVFSISFLDSPVFSNSIKLCSASMAFFIASQSATLYSIAVICAYRFIIAKRVNQATVEFSKYKIAIPVAFVWPVSIICCSLPFAIWTQKDDKFVNDGCSMESALQDNIEKLMKVLLVIFVLPLIFTNVMYCGVFIYLRRSWNMVRPSLTSESDTNIALNNFKNSVPGTSKTSDLKESSLLSCHEGTLYKTDDYSNKANFQKNARIVIGAVNTVKAFQKTSQQLSVFQTFKGAQKHNRDESKTETETFKRQEPKQTTSARNDLHKENVTSVTSGITGITARRQKRAYVLLGSILLFLNLFTLPGLIVLLMESKISTWTFTRGTKFPLFTTVSCNAWVNPILYTIQVNEFRAIFRVYTATIK